MLDFYLDIIKMWPNIGKCLLQFCRCLIICSLLICDIFSRMFHTLDIFLIAGSTLCLRFLKIPISLLVKLRASLPAWQLDNATFRFYPVRRFHFLLLCVFHLMGQLRKTRQTRSVAQSLIYARNLPKEAEKCPRKADTVQKSAA